MSSATAPKRFAPDVETRVHGIPCGIVIEFFSAGSPMVITGSGFGDAEPPEPAECEWFLVDRHGYRADWLYSKLDDDDINDITERLISGDLR